MESQENLFKMFDEVDEQQDDIVVIVEKGIEPVKSKENVGKNAKMKKKESATLTKPKKAEKPEEQLVDTTPRTVGTCTLDLIPLFLGF